MPHRLLCTLAPKRGGRLRLPPFTRKWNQSGRCYGQWHLDRVSFVVGPYVNASRNHLEPGIFHAFTKVVPSQVVNLFDLIADHERQPAELQRTDLARKEDLRLSVQFIERQTVVEDLALDNFRAFNGEFAQLLPA